MSGLFYVEGFDKYGPVGDTIVDEVIAGEWSTGINCLVAVPLSARGAAIALTTALMTSSFPAIGRFSGSLRYKYTNAAGSIYIGFQNGGSFAFSLTILASSGGLITLRNTSLAGTTVNSGGATTTNSTNVLSWDITVGANALYAVYLNGALLFSGTGNTGTGQTSVNTITLSNSASPGSSIDDICLFDPTATGYNNAILTVAPVVETQWPNADAQTQFTNDMFSAPPSGILVRGVFNTITSATMAGNFVNLLKFTVPVNCTINSVSGYAAVVNSTVKYRAVLYADSAGVPGALLSSGTEGVGTPIGVFTGALVTPQALIGGTNYWMGFITDTGVSIAVYDGSVLATRKSATYASGPPNPAGTGFAAGNPTYMIWGNCVGSAVNWPNVSLNPVPLYNTSQTHSSTVGQKDLFTFPALAGSPTVYGVAVKGFVRKTDTGGRTVSFHTRSGGVDSAGSSQNMSTSAIWQKSVFPTDPLTGTVWAADAVNAAANGVSVAS